MTTSQRQAYCIKPAVYVSLQIVLGCVGILAAVLVLGDNAAGAKRVLTGEALLTVLIGFLTIAAVSFIAYLIWASFRPVRQLNPTDPRLIFASLGSWFAIGAAGLLIAA